MTYRDKRRTEGMEKRRLTQQVAIAVFVAQAVEKLNSGLKGKVTL